MSAMRRAIDYLKKDERDTRAKLKARDARIAALELEIAQLRAQLKAERAIADDMEHAATVFARELSR